MRLSVEPSREPDDHPFSCPIRVRFAETDAMGIVHHSRYLPYLEQARVEYLRSIGHPYVDLRREGRDFTVLECLVQYRRPLRFDELVDVHLRIAAATRTTFQITYLLTVDADVRATAVTVHGCVNTNGGAQRLPLWLIERCP